MLVDKSKCTGCGACVQSCPRKCIEWQMGEFGFNYPKINNELCVNCGICEKVCPVNKQFHMEQIKKAFAFVNLEKQVLQTSSSGGAFSAIATSVLKDGGIVYGCSMEKNFQVQHIRIFEIRDLEKLRGSKYVQSDIRETYKQTKIDLEKGVNVLFSGTPCQIAGLYGYLGREYGNLLTIDIICHGVGSQKYFDKFIEYLQSVLAKLEKIEFRNKKFVGWSCGGVLKSSGKLTPFYNYQHYYYSYFLASEIYRESCYSCSYATMERIGDITLGDFWGAESLNIGFDTSNGCSLVIINSNKGLSAIKNLDDQVAIKQVKTSVAIKNNAQLSRPSERPKSRELRIKEYNTMSGLEIQKEYVRLHKKRILKGKVKTLIPYKAKLKLRKLLG